MRLSDLGELSKRAVRGWIDDAAPSMGAALAFYALLSMAPLLLVALGVAGIFLDRNEAQDALIAQVTVLLGEKAAHGVETILQAAESRGGSSAPAVLGVLMMMLGASTVFAELRSDLDRIWRYKPSATGIRKALSARFFAFLMVLSIGLLLIFSMLASTFLATLGAYWFEKSPAMLHMIEFFSSFVVATLLFALIYKILPSQRIEWGDVWVGAAVTSVLFWVGKFLIALYLGKAAVDSSFGAAGAVVMLIVWVYYSAQVFFLGAEFTKEYALRHGSKQGARLGAPSLAEMNGPYEELLERARRIKQRRDPIFGGD